MQDLDVLDQACVDKIARCIREAARVELVAQRYAIDQDRHPVAADAADIDAFGAKPRSGCLVIDARNIAKHITD